MESKSTSGDNGATDAELKQWLGKACPIVARALKLPRPMEKAADRALEAVSVATALRWMEMLRLGSPDEVRLTAQSVPDAAARLSSPEGQQAIRSWEATHRVVPMLWALERAVKAILAFWRTGGHPRRAVIRALAALGVSPVVPGAAGFQEQLATAIGSGQSEAVSLIEEYAAATVTDKVNKIESVDGLVSRGVPFGPWVRSLWVCLKLRSRKTKRTTATDFESGHPLWRLSLIVKEIAGIKGKQR